MTPEPPTAARRPAAVVFDVEGVLAHPDPARLAEGLRDLSVGLTAAQLQAARETAPLYRLWTEYSVGRLSSDAYWRRVLEVAAGGRVSDADLAAVRAAMRLAWWGRLDERVLALARQLRSAGVITGLLSNSAPEHEATIDVLVADFDAARFSHRVGHRKPDEAAFRGILAALGTRPSETVFVDDKPRNTEAAAAMGMPVHTFRSAAALAAFLADQRLLPAAATE